MRKQRTKIGKEKVPGMGLKESQKRQIDAAVKKTVKEYGEVLRLLGRS